MRTFIFLFKLVSFVILVAFMPKSESLTGDAFFSLLLTGGFIYLAISAAILYWDYCDEANHQERLDEALLFKSQEAQEGQP